jgi:hypothetical protein
MKWTQTSLVILSEVYASNSFPLSIDRVEEARARLRRLVASQDKEELIRQSCH